MKFSKVVTIALAISVSMLLTACNDESEDSVKVTGLSSIVGVYDWSDTYDDGSVDEWYLAIDADGYISDYDYQGDSFDLGENCYYIDRNWDRLTHIEGNKFSVSEDGHYSNYVVDLEVSFRFVGGKLTVDYVDDEDGPTTITIGKKTNRSTSDFEALECGDD